MVPFLRVIDRSYKGNTVVNLEKKNTIIFVPFFLFLQIVFLHLFIYYKKSLFETLFKLLYDTLVMVKTARRCKEMKLTNVTGGKSTKYG